MADKCAAILQGGVFDSIAMTVGRSFSENVRSWLLSASDDDFRFVIDNGGFVGIPIDGAELGIKPKLTLEDLHQAKQMVQTGNFRDFSCKEVMQLVRRNASPVIVDAWLKCITYGDPEYGMETTGLLGRLVPPEGDEHVVLKLRYLPTGIDDHPPRLLHDGFQLAGATTKYPLSEGEEIPWAGTSILLEREGTDEITVNINTDKGSKTFSSPSIAPPPLNKEDLRLDVKEGEYDGHIMYRTIDAQILGDDRYYENNTIVQVSYKYWSMYMAIYKHREETFTLANRVDKYLWHFRDPLEGGLVHITAVVLLSNGQQWTYEWCG